MSRFDHKYYKEALESPPIGRSYIACRWEKPLWKRWNRPRQLVLMSIIFFLIAIFLSAPGFSLLFSSISPGVSAIIAFTSVGLILVVCMFNIIYVRFVGLKNVRARKNMEFVEFIEKTTKLKDFCSDEVKIVRNVLGFVYTVPSEIIYPDDQGESLALLGQLYEPYVFELVLGVANRLNIKLSDSEIDSIIKSIYGKTKDVEELISTLLHELNNIHRATDGTSFQ